MPALTFYPLPQEKKWLSIVSGFADSRPIQSYKFSKGRRTILPLLGERAGARAGVKTYSIKNVEGIICATHVTRQPSLQRCAFLPTQLLLLTQQFHAVGFGNFRLAGFLR